MLQPGEPHPPFDVADAPRNIHVVENEIAVLARQKRKTDDMPTCRYFANEIRSDVIKTFHSS
jgi:hypothetical protein